MRAPRPVIVAVLCGLGCITFEPIGARCVVSDTCAAGSVCSNQVCITPECAADVDCKAGQICVASRCSQPSATGSTGSGGNTGDTGSDMTGATGGSGATFTITDVRGTSANLDTAAKPRVIDMLRILGSNIEAATTVTAIDQADAQAFTLPIVSTASGEITVSVPDALATRVQIQSGVTVALSVQQPSGTVAPLVRINRGEQGAPGPNGSRGPTGPTGAARPAGQPVICNNDGWRIFAGDVQCATGPVGPSASVWIAGDASGTPIAPTRMTTHATLAITASTASGALRVANAAAGGATLKVVGNADFSDVLGATGGLALPFYLRRAHCTASCTTFEVACDAGDRAFAVACHANNDVTLNGSCPICSTGNCLDAQACGGCAPGDTVCHQRVTPYETTFATGVRCEMANGSTDAMGYVLCVRDQ